MTSKLQLLLISKWQDESWREAQSAAIREGIAERRKEQPQWGRPKKALKAVAKAQK